MLDLHVPSIERLHEAAERAHLEEAIIGLFALHVKVALADRPASPDAAVAARGHEPYRGQAEEELRGRRDARLLERRAEHEIEATTDELRQGLVPVLELVDQRLEVLAQIP